MKVGILGGTFNPVHNGHIVVAEETLAHLGLEEVIFVPAGQPWMKDDSPVLEAEHRVQMIRLAIASYPRFKLSTIEIERAGPSYTVDTMIELQAQPGDGRELFFILGWDSLEQLPQWQQVDRLIQLCHLVAVPRPGYSAPDLPALEAAVPGLSKRLLLLDRPEIDISASEIRSRVAGGLSIDHMVPPSVEKYIRANNLYLSKQEA